ncbi:MAG: polyprenyl diphosphate synthase [Phycisphaerales bacterium]|nr:polyprenyl diphosphate synthase [Phycisphaerales bacterium]
MTNTNPQHIAIIMDGNGRWAESRGLPRSAGHEAGAESVKKIVERCGELDIPFLTLYSFSTENWSRPQKEIDALMGLLVHKLVSEVSELIANGVSIRHYGGRERFSPEVLEALDDAIEATSGGEQLVIGLALDYSGRSELVQAVDRLVQDGAEVNEDNIEKRLFTYGVPDPDLLIRTAGEMRVSNFLLWQIAYSEIYVTNQCWPDFDGGSLDAAIAEFASRKRTYGKIS